MATLSATLGNGPVSLMFAQRDIAQLDHAARYIQALRYGRTSEPDEPLSVLRESIGTCTLKHALLKLAAEEAGATDVELRFGVFEMSDSTTPGIGHVLRSYGLECVPEAHCYLAIDDDRLDFTGLPLGPESPFAHLLTEECLAVSVVLKDKARRHRAIVEAWALERQLDPVVVWRAREACIQVLASRGLTPQVRPAAKDERRHIEYMMGPYLAGFGAPPDFAYPNLGAYWNDPSRYPYIIAHGARFVGFALVHRVTNAPTFELVEFYVAAEFRRRGFGRAAAEALFMLHLGTWSIAIRNDNPSGRAFWRPVLARYPVTMREATQPPGVIYTFEAG